MRKSLCFRRILWPTTAALLCATACTEPTLIEPDEVEDVTSAQFGEDPYAIGSDWYDYDGRTHVLTPKTEVYAVRASDGRAALVEVAGYYSDKGVSGIFSLRGRDAGSGAWGEVSEIVLTGNVKDAPVCAAIGPVREVPCDGPDASLVFRTEWRPIPEAGFAVSNPAIYAVRGTSIVVMQADALEDIADAPGAVTEMDATPSVDVDPGLARIGWVYDEGALTDARTHLQVTSSLGLAKWSLTSMQVGGELSIGLQVACQGIDLTEQPDFSGEPMGVTLTSPMPGTSSTTLVRLCTPGAEAAPEVVEWREGGFYGLWPDTTTFDLMIVREGDDVAVLLAPGSLVRSHDDPAEIDITTLWDTEEAE